MPNEAELHPHVPEEKANLFSAQNAIALEEEVGLLLFSLVRCFKPERVLETGCGLSTPNIALALKLNGLGGLISIDRRAEPIIAAGEFIEKERIAQNVWVRFVQTDSVEWLKTYPGPSFQFAFLDSSLEDRTQELRILISRGLIHGYVLVHDTSRHRGKSLSDCPEFPVLLDAMNLRSVESNLSRGWRLFQVP
jgi:predicted O-methyltransferase YrrM